MDLAAFEAQAGRCRALRELLLGGPAHAAPPGGLGGPAVALARGDTVISAEK